MPERKLVNVLDIPFHNMTMKELKSIIESFINSEHSNNLFIVTANPEIVYYAHKYEGYKTRILSADYIIPDGIGIIKAAKILKKPLTERMPGIELMEEMLILADQYKKKVFLLGASKKTVKACQRNLKKKYPNIKFKSKHGYKDIHDYKRLEQVKNFEPDFIFVAMGYPKQESWIYYNQHHFNHTVLMGVGGSFDVFSGNVKRAPEIFIKMNMEWLYRALSDIKRIRRIMVIPKFMWKVYVQRFNDENDPHAHFSNKE